MQVGSGQSAPAVGVRRAVADGMTVVWLGAGHNDNYMVWFLSHVIDAIRVVQPSLAAGPGQVNRVGFLAAPMLATSPVGEWIVESNRWPRTRRE